MKLYAKHFLTAAALTNPLLWMVAALGIALAMVSLGVLVLWGIYRYLRDEWTIPVRPKPVPSIGLQPVAPPLFGLVIPKPTPVTPERRLAIIAAERGYEAPMACAQAEAPAVVRQRPKAAKKVVVTKAKAKPKVKRASPPAKGRRVSA